MAEPQTTDAPLTDGAAPEKWSTSAYRPHLDGLRAVAVYLVVLFHAGLTKLSGGYIGVDVFFVLSGYLVTQLLLRDVATGSIRFGRFYARRFRRLLPAAFVTLMVTAIVFAAVTPSGAAAAYGAFRAAFLYVANWYFIKQSTSYFGGAVASNPVLQFWSLAVEEQFYLLWPLTLAGMFWIARRTAIREAALVRALVALGGLVSLLWALHLRVGNVDRAVLRYRRARLPADGGSLDRPPPRPVPHHEPLPAPGAAGGSRRGRRASSGWRCRSTDSIRSCAASRSPR